MKAAAQKIQGAIVGRHERKQVEHVNRSLAQLDAIAGGASGGPLNNTATASAANAGIFLTKSSEWEAAVGIIKGLLKGYESRLKLQMKQRAVLQIQGVLKGRGEKKQVENH